MLGRKTIIQSDQRAPARLGEQAQEGVVGLMTARHPSAAVQKKHRPGGRRVLGLIEAKSERAPRQFKPAVFQTNFGGFNRRAELGQSFQATAPRFNIRDRRV